MKPDQRAILEDKLTLWRDASKTASMDLRDYHRRAADALETLLNPPRQLVPYALEPFFAAAVAIAAQPDAYGDRIALLGSLAQPADLTKRDFTRLLEAKAELLALQEQQEHKTGADYLATAIYAVEVYEGWTHNEEAMVDAVVERRARLGMEGFSDNQLVAFRVADAVMAVP
jgi:hypothetical protein